ncbi:hypothetical protein ACJX0J_012274 [Zea mays]
MELNVALSKQMVSKELKPLSLLRSFWISVTVCFTAWMTSLVSLLKKKIMHMWFLHFLLTLAFFKVQNNVLIWNIGFLGFELHPSKCRPLTNMLPYFFYLY